MSTTNKIILISLVIVAGIVSYFLITKRVIIVKNECPPDDANEECRRKPIFGECEESYSRNDGITWKFQSQWSKNGLCYYKPIVSPEMPYKLVWDGGKCYKSYSDGTKEWVASSLCKKEV